MALPAPGGHCAAVAQTGHAGVACTTPPKCCAAARFWWSITRRAIFSPSATNGRHTIEIIEKTLELSMVLMTSNATDARKVTVVDMR